jgi:hypothetical protein
MGPLTVKEAESLVFVAARGLPHVEASHRTWLEDDRSYFVRWREDREGSPLRIIGLVRAYQLPEMASRIELIPFADEVTPPLREYAGALRYELEKEGFA